MTKSIIVFILMLFLLVFFVYAQPPVTQVFTGDVGLTIENPLVSFGKQNRDVISHLHVFNSSTGFAVTNITTSCFLHIYNVSGSEIFAEDYPYNAEEEEWELLIGGRNFSLLEQYGFLIQCNTSTVGGFVRGKLEITKSGIEEKRFMLPILIGIIAIMVFFGVVGYSTKSKNIKAFGYGIALIQLVNIPFILYMSEAGESLITILEINFWSVFLLAFGIGMVGLIKWTIRLINPADEEEENKEKGKWEK